MKVVNDGCCCCWSVVVSLRNMACWTVTNRTKPLTKDKRAALRKRRQVEPMMDRFESINIVQLPILVAILVVVHPLSDPRRLASWSPAD